jgi:GDP-mannose 6-dehydrogenase
VRALTSAARHRDVEVPLLSSLEPSNRIPVEEALHAVLSFGRPRIGVVGLSFKEATDDMRESPYLELVERLCGKGLDLRIFDPDVRWKDVYGSNREFVLRELPHVAELLVPDLESLGERDVVVLGKEVPGLLDHLRAMPGPVLVLDLVGAVADPGELDHAYRGIAW